MDFCRFFLILILFLNRLEVEMIFRNFAMCVFFWVSFGFHYFKILGETVFTWIVETEGQGWVLISWTRDLSRAARAAAGTSVLEVGGNQGLLFQFRQNFNLLQIIFKGCSSEPFFWGAPWPGCQWPRTSSPSLSFSAFMPVLLLPTAAPRRLTTN